MEKRIAWIVGVVGSILYSTLCAFVGYGLNSYMSRDHIAIQEVQLVANRTPIKLDYIAYQAMVACSQPVAVQTSMLSTPLDVGLWLDTNGNVRNGQEDRLHAALYARETALTVHRERLVETRDRIAELEEGDDLPGDIELQWRFMFRPNEDISVNEIRASLAELLQITDKCATDLNGIRKEVSGWETAQKTGELTLLVTLLNTGDTDGLVQPRGRFTIKGVSGDISIDLSREYPPPHDYWAHPYSSALAGQYAPAAIEVARRSMIMEKFVVSVGNSPPEAVAALKDRIEHGSTMSVTIELTDMRGDGIKWNGIDRVAE